MCIKLLISKLAVPAAAWWFTVCTAVLSEVLTSCLLQAEQIQPSLSSNCPIPIIERTTREIKVVLSTYQVPAQIEQITDCSMRGNKSLGL